MAFSGTAHTDTNTTDHISSVMCIKNCCHETWTKGKWQNDFNNSFKWLYSCSQSEYIFIDIPNKVLFSDMGYEN